MEQNQRPKHSGENRRGRESALSASHKQFANNMADVCLTAPSVLSPISPNENRKRRHGYSDAGDGCGGTWFKRHRTGSSFARRLLHLRGFSVDVRQAEELVRFIDQLPQEMDKVSAFFLVFFLPSLFFFPLT